jgi:hypothetical protein
VLYSFADTEVEARTQDAAFWKKLGEGTPAVTCAPNWLPAMLLGSRFSPRSWST